MRRWATAAALAAVVLVACSPAKSRDFSRYYDPGGLFSTNLPSANDISVTPGATASGGPSILAGVVSSPPQPTPTPSSAAGAFGGLTQPTQAQDMTVYQALVVTTGSLQDVSQMSLAFLTSNPAVDVQVEQPVTLAGADGELVVADVLRNGQKVAGVAAVFTLGRDGVGYIVAAVFPPGQWSTERPDFLKVVASFRPTVPPGLLTFPLSSGGA